MNEKIKTYLPIFSGFYGTLFEDLMAEYDEDGNEIAVTAEEYAERQLRVGELCVAYVEEKLHECGLLGFAGLDFERIKSPREYNFANDEIHVVLTCDPERLAKWIGLVIDARRQLFAERLKKDFTGYDGYFPYYDPWVEDWMPPEIDHKFKAGYYLAFVLEELTDADEEGMVEYVQGQLC